MMGRAMGVIVPPPLMVFHEEIAALIDIGTSTGLWSDYCDDELKWLELSYLKTARDLESLPVAAINPVHQGEI